MKREKARFLLKLSAVLWLLFGLVPLFGQERAAIRQKRAFPQIQLRHQVRNEEAIRALGLRLPAVADWYGKSTQEMTRLLRRDRNLWVAPTGRLLYACEMELPFDAEEVAAAEASRDHISSFPLDQTFKLHSLPGSSRVIYLDFNGETVSGTAWNANYNSGADIIAAPFDLDGSPETFSTTELQRIQNIWQRVAEDYAPFDVDVTTEEPTADALTRSSTSDSNFGNRVIITPTDFYPNAGGVSYVGTFDSVGDYYKISWAFSNKLQNGEKYIAEACSHENGHAVGLHHMGTSSVTYYQGQGDWAPIMGNSYYKNVTQWAKGEYTGANNTEDQLLIIGQNGLNYYADDHGNAADAATILSGPTTLSGSGFIEQNTDVDVFQFQTGAGAISIGVTPSPLGPNLKILAELYDAGGSLVTSSSLSNLGASINQTVPAGTYYLSVSGVGSGDPLTTGYSSYASLGQYVISGTVIASGSSNPPTASISAAPTSGNAPLAVSFSGSGSTDDGTIASYSWNFGDGSAVSGDPNPSHTYTSAGIFTARLTVTDNEGLTDTETTTITVTKDIYVSALTLASSSSTTAVSASAAVTIKDRSGNAIAGAVVNSSWSGIVSGTVSGTTNSSGAVTLASPQSSASGTFIFAVTGVSASGHTYNPVLNVRSSSSIAANLVSVPVPPNAVISATPTSGEAPLAVSFTGAGSTDDSAIAAYSWNFGDGSAASSSANPSHVYASAGTFTAVLTVTDNEGLTNTASVNITANPAQNPIDGTPPIINVTSPTSGSNVLGNVSIQVHAIDNVAVKKVELYVDGVLKATSTVAPFTTKWNTKRVAAGPHTIRAKAYDTAGNQSLSAAVTVSVNATVSKTIPIKPSRRR